MYFIFTLTFPLLLKFQHQFSLLPLPIPLPYILFTLILTFTCLVYPYPHLYPYTTIPSIPSLLLPEPQFPFQHPPSFLLPRTPHLLSDTLSHLSPLNPPSHPLLSFTCLPLIPPLHIPQPSISHSIRHAIHHPTPIPVHLPHPSHPSPFPPPTESQSLNPNNRSATPYPSCNPLKICSILLSNSCLNLSNSAKAFSSAILH